MTGIAILQARGLFEVNNSRLESAAMKQAKEAVDGFHAQTVRSRSRVKGAQSEVKFDGIHPG
jgi:hypothetical protein